MGSMQIETKVVEHNTVVEISGSIDALTSRELQSHIENLIDLGNRNIVIDLEQVEFMSSAGLRVMLAMSKRINQAGERFSLAAPRPVIENMLRVSGFIGILKVFPSTELAFESSAE
jgi:anti-anti-sigma factor